MYIMYVCMQPLSIVKRYQLFLFQNFSYVKNLLQFVNNSFTKKKKERKTEINTISEFMR